MPWDTLIRNGQVVTRDGVRALDLAIEGDAIVALAPELSGDARDVIDARGLHVFPGVIDAHVHFNEPGRTDWEGWATGSSALAAGGGTCCFEMPLNAHPPTLDAASFDLKRAAAEASSRVDFALWGGLTPENLDTLDELADCGVVGLKAFMSSSGIDDFGRADDETLRRGMAVAARRGLIVGVHAEDEQQTRDTTEKFLNVGKDRSWDAYLATRPISAEQKAIEAACVIARETGAALHVVHVSSSLGILMIAGLKAAGINVTSETCPHYLLLTAGDLRTLGASAKCAPPLREPHVADALRQRLVEGKIDLVASDHSPAPASMKTGDDAFKIWGGISGVQSTLPALLTIGVPPTQAAMLTATNVTERFGIARKGEVKIGYDADLALVDVDATYTLTRDMLLDRHKLSPYVGRRFTGLVKRTIARGQTIFQDGKMVGTSRGRFVQPERSGR